MRVALPIFESFLSCSFIASGCGAWYPGSFTCNLFGGWKKKKKKERKRSRYEFVGCGVDEKRPHISIWKYGSSRNLPQSNETVEINLCPFTHALVWFWICRCRARNVRWPLLLLSGEGRFYILVQSRFWICLLHAAYTYIPTYIH